MPEDVDTFKGTQHNRLHRTALLPLSMLNIIGLHSGMILSAVLYTFLELVYLRLYPLHLYLNR